MVDPILDNLTYNLTNIISPKIINEPNLWLAAFNNEMSGYFIITSLAVIGIVLFIAARNMNVKDSEAAVYSGMIISVAGLLLFFVDTGSYVKLVTWPQEFILIVITAISIFINKFRQKY